ncbi:YihA family ribosome biogenesis GTP-binding protein [Anoxybacillus sp. UARK-01]|uniref:Probable GTP-binding protein EngB n=1 Tax=Anoxybacteroides rupiense TaxID=311460 RepID=A0ABD5IUD0_9BACL|nr:MULTISPECIES: ribosome biogenesis GTP-binding protein YihA/YsxC [Anoxybacillus]MED5051051.1 ribosome biogenesis GTP-binding protein YihA/YsxC [Anoxybacillus rupiensis]OQM45687.1 YihA family ribosome biogenesis GTP-binding protein [Anoxybacillus sp. UARK-01]
MKVTAAEITISAVKPEQYPAGMLPEFALAGRSNVGKSSFINKMINRKNLARTSSKPGKTQTLNFYLINEAFYFVDVPGYGFAKVSKQERQAWGKMMETYFTTREQLKAVILVIDLRHPPTKDDVMMYEFLKYHQLPTIVVATKADKVPKGKWPKHQKVVRETLKMAKEDEVILFSAETGQGKEEAWSALLRKM